MLEPKELRVWVNLANADQPDIKMRIAASRRGQNLACYDSTDSCEERAATLSKPLRRLTLAGLVAATYFMVAGGPYGLEDVIGKAGYATTLLILVSTPRVWSLPTALMVGELSSALPSDGGYYVWVKRALGRFWGFQEAWLTLTASVFDMAIYPTLFVSYLGRIAPTRATGRNALLIGIAVMATAVVWNLFGAKSVSSGSIWLGVVLLSPFAALVVVALVRHAHGAATATYSPSADLLGGIMVAMWNFMGWDNASTVAGEVQDAQRTYPKAMLISAVLVALSYMVPVAAMWWAGVPVEAWKTGAWADVAGMVGGGVMALMVVVGGMISGAGMFNALTMSYSRLPLVIAEDGLLPRFLALTNDSNAPWVSLLACAAGWAFCLNLGFEHLIQLDILLYGASLLLEFVALVVLRVKEPELQRPFRIPLGTWWCGALAIGPLCLLALSLIRSESEKIAGVNALLFGAGLMAFGMAVYPVLAAFARKPAMAGEGYVS